MESSNTGSDRMVTILGVQDYTDPDEIIRGSSWPPVDIYFGVRITHPIAWPVAAAGWTWTMQLSRQKRGSTPDLVITATSATIVGGDVMELAFKATSVQTTSLPGTEDVVYHVDIKSVGGLGSPSFYDCVQGTAQVRNAAGEG